MFHPDKHVDQELKDVAQRAFGKLIEAYEVLSDVQKRQIYDIYGKQVTLDPAAFCKCKCLFVLYDPQGLAAGFEVGDRLHSKEELRKEWEEFKRRRDQEQEESSRSIRGLYPCRLDATDVSR